MRSRLQPIVSFVAFSVLLAGAASAQVATVTPCTTPVVTAVNSGPYMEGSTVSLTSTTVDNATYSWSGPGNFTSTLQNPTIGNAVAANSGVYTVTVSNACGSANASTTVSVWPEPTISIDNVVAKAPAKGQQGAFTFHITLSNPSVFPVSVNYYTSNMTAIAGKDYVTTCGTTVFQPGVTEQDETVVVIGTGSSLTKRFAVNLDKPVNASIALYYGFRMRGIGVMEP